MKATQPHIQLMATHDPGKLYNKERYTITQQAQNHHPLNSSPLTM